MQRNNLGEMLVDVFDWQVEEEEEEGGSELAPCDSQH